MKKPLETILHDKREGRLALAQPSFSEKIAVLEKLRERRQAIAASALRQRVEKR